MVQGRWLRLTALPRADEPAPRLGVVTSRRVGGAVQRNRVRRRIREIFRVRREEVIAGLWLVVVAKPGAGEASFSDLRDEWLRLGRRLSIFRDP